MKRHSTKRAAQERKLRKIEKQLIAEGNTHCFFFKHKHASSFHHIVSKAQNIALIDCKKNLVPVCDEAHYIIDHGTTDQIKKLPHLREYLQRMKKLDESYWRRFMTNHDLWEEEDNDGCFRFFTTE